MSDETTPAYCQDKVSHTISNCLHQALIASSFQQLKSFGRIDSATMRPVAKGTDISFDHWISEIEIELVGVESKFRVHYTSGAARDLIKHLLRTRKGTPAFCQSSIAEFCNITLGMVKRQFTRAFKESFDLLPQFQVSVPKTTPSYDVGRLGINGKRADRCNAWEIRWGNNSLILESYVEIDPTALYQLLCEPRGNSVSEYLGSLHQLADLILQELPTRPEDSLSKRDAA